MNINRKLFNLTVFDFDDKVILEPATSIVEHGDGNFLRLFFVQYS